MCYRHQGRNCPESIARHKQAAGVTSTGLDRLSLERRAVRTRRRVGSHQHGPGERSLPSLLLLRRLPGRRGASVGEESLRGLDQEPQALDSIGACIPGPASTQEREGAGALFPRDTQQLRERP